MADQTSHPYATHLDVYYAPLEVVDVPALVAACTDRWYNQTLTRVNDAVVRLGVMQGEYHWHKHEAEDEFFYVVEGRFLIDLEHRGARAAAGVHRPQRRGAPHPGAGEDRGAHGRGAGVVPTGD